VRRARAPRISTCFAAACAGHAALPLGRTHDRAQARLGARSPLLAEPPLSDQTLIDHFGSLRDSADWWVALKLTGADATQENAKTVCRRLLLRLHPDKCKLPAAAEAFRKLNHFRDKIAKRPYSMSAPAHGSGIRPVPAKPPRTATATAPGRGRSTAKPPTAAPPKAAPAQPKPAPPKPAPAPPKPALRKPAPPLPAPPKPPSAPPKPPSAPAAAASDADKAECKACKGWKRPHTCGKIRGKPGPKPRHREGCQGCLGLHMAHTCGLRGRPEARQPHVWSTRPSPEIPPEIPHVRAQTKAKVEAEGAMDQPPPPKRQKAPPPPPPKEGTPTAKSTGPLGNARPRAKVRRAAAPESPPHGGGVATLPELTHACARTGSRATGTDRV